MGPSGPSGEEVGLVEHELPQEAEDVEPLRKQPFVGEVLRRLGDGLVPQFFDLALEF